MAFWVLSVVVAVQAVLIVGLAWLHLRHLHDFRALLAILERHR